MQTEGRFSAAGDVKSPPKAVPVSKMLFVIATEP